MSESWRTVITSVYSGMGEVLSAFRNAAGTLWDGAVMDPASPPVPG